MTIENVDWPTVFDVWQQTLYMWHYQPRTFGELIGRSVKTLGRWDEDGTLVACRTPANLRYYTHEQYLEYIKQKAGKG